MSHNRLAHGRASYGRERVTRAASRAFSLWRLPEMIGSCRTTMASGIRRRSPKQRRSETLSLFQGFVEPSKASRAVWFAVFMALPEKVCLVTLTRMPFFEPRPCSGLLERCRTRNGSSSRRCSRSRMALSVHDPKAWPKRARSAAARRGRGSHVQAFRSAWNHRTSARIPSTPRCCSGVAGTSLDMSRLEKPQHTAWLPVRSWAATSDVITDLGSRPGRKTAPQSALPVAMFDLVATA